MTEFKKGDRVRVSDHPTRYQGRTASPSIAGKEMTVSGTDHITGDWVVDFDGGDEGWFVGGESLTLIEDVPDMVNHPSHYSAGMPEGIEVIDIIRSQGWEDNYNLGNATKYLLRCEHKGTKKQDLEKLLVYVQWELNRL